MSRVAQIYRPSSTEGTNIIISIPSHNDERRFLLNIYGYVNTIRCIILEKIQLAWKRGLEWAGKLIDSTESFMVYGGRMARELYWGKRQHISCFHSFCKVMGHLIQGVSSHAQTISTSSPSL